MCIVVTVQEGSCLLITQYIQPLSCNKISYNYIVEPATSLRTYTCMYMYVLGCPLGLGLVVEGKLTEFSRIWYGCTIDVILYIHTWKEGSCLSLCMCGLRLC